MFHDLGLVPAYSSASHRFEVDGANAARDFLQGHNLSEQEIEQVWTSIALHTTPDIPKYMHPVVALLTAGVEMDVLGIDYSNFQEADRAAIVQQYPRTPHFKEDILQAFSDGIKHKPETTFGKRKSRCAGRQRSYVSPRQLLLCDLQFTLARLKAKGRSNECQRKTPPDIRLLDRSRFGSGLESELHEDTNSRLQAFHNRPSVVGARLIQQCRLP
jgi:hypothetical protein